MTRSILHVVSAHAKGEVGDVIAGGVAPPPGEILWEQAHQPLGDRARRVTSVHQHMLDPADPWPWMS
ncbi:MAG: hypothetical protein ACTSP2_10040 [Alphaproteobacteria bacterium]